MRRYTAVLYALALTACGVLERTTGIGPGTVHFTRDANTCGASYPVAYDFYSDGALLGSAILLAGQSKDFNVSAGDHVFSARIENTSYTFNPLTGRVSAGTTFNYTMVC